MDSASHLFTLHRDAVLDPTAFAELPEVALSPAGEQALAAFRDILAGHPPEQLEKRGHVPKAVLRLLGKQGLFGLTIPVEHGGLGLPFSEYLRVVAEMAKSDLSLAMASLAHLSIGLQGIVLFGTPEQQQRWLPAAARGSTVFAYALTEPATGSDAQHIATRARLSEDGAHYLLDGQKTYITNANYADGFTVFAQLDGGSGMVALVVERDSEGLTVGPDMPKMGLKASSTAFLRFDGVRVPVANRLGEPGEGFRVAMAILNYGRLAVCAAGVGLMEQSLVDMARRAKQRQQFGVAIGTFELIQEKLAAARVDGFIAGSMVDFAARQLERDATANVAMETSHCKLFATNRAWHTLYEAMQVAGGSGYLATNPYEKRMRDYRVATIFEGTSEIHSIYPAGFLLRAFAGALPRGGAARVRALLGGALRRLRWADAGGGPVERRAHRTARRCARAARFLGHLALAVHGEEVGRREFVLRRITWLSTYAYGLLAAEARVRALVKARGPEGAAAERELVEAFRDEARSALWQLWRPWNSAREKRVGRIVSRLQG
ncbi:MAG: acyl-CoA dehydrogenase family protein [Deferrisomatales bacterium]|nr:acyl-CoA dehydrogenase family protein [Deferrisomatales bacterium]